MTKAEKEAAFAALPPYSPEKYKSDSTRFLEAQSKETGKSIGDMLSMELGKKRVKMQGKVNNFLAEIQAKRLEQEMKMKEAKEEEIVVNEGLDALHNPNLDSNPNSNPN